MASNLLAGLNIGGDSSVDLLTLSKASGPVSFPLVTTPEFVKLLATSGIQGPHHLSGVCLDRRGRLIGQGSQFMVFEDTLPALDSMVMKRINADVIEHPLVSQELDDRRKGHLRTLWLEILALSHPPIRAHPNITKLLSWGFDYPNYGRKMALPVLFAEKALCSLEDLLTKPRAYEEKSLSVAVRYQLCLDILEGLICLHRAEIVHGDIKPANILIFRNADPQVPFVAKLNDFGMCIPLQPEVQVDCNMYGGTPGWRAPEVIEASRTKGSTHKASLYLCDVFTFGLVVCSVFFCSGSAPFDQEVVSTETYAKKALRLIDDQAPATGIEEDLMSKLKVFFCNTLSMDPAQRHGLHRGMLATSNHAFSTWCVNRPYYRHRRLSRC